MKFTAYISFFLLLNTQTIVAKDAAFEEFENLQKSYLAQPISHLNFQQKSYLSDLEDPLLAEGYIKINRKKKNFLWQVLTPSLFSFSIENKLIKMKMGDQEEQSFSIKDLPQKFKFFLIFFELLGFQELKPNSWVVTKTKKNHYNFESKLRSPPINKISIRLFSSGQPKMISFKNTVNTRFEIFFKKNKIKKNKIK